LAIPKTIFESQLYTTCRFCELVECQKFYLAGKAEKGKLVFFVDAVKALTHDVRFACFRITRRLNKVYDLANSEMIQTL